MSKITKRDAQGKILPGGITLSSEEAKAMANKRHSKKVQQKQGDAEILLAEAGYDDPTEAPKVLQLVAEQIAERGARSIQAVVQYRQLTSPQPGSSLGKPASGENCPLCGVVNLRGLTFTKEQLESMARMLQAERDHYQKTGEAITLRKLKKGGPSVE